MKKVTAKQILARIDRRLDKLGLSDNAAGEQAGQRDIIRGIRRQVKSGKQHSVAVETVEKLARVLKTSFNWLMTETGPEEAENILPIVDAERPDERPMIPTVPVIGYVGAGSEAHYYAVAQGEWDEVPAPEGATEFTRAVEIRGTSLGALFDRWLVFYDDVRRPVTSDLIGKLCIVGLADDRVLVKKIQRAKDHLFNLISNTEDPIKDVAIEWAALVKNMTPR